MHMVSQEDRRFKLALTIKDPEHVDMPGAHAVIALLDDDGVPTLVVEAGGFPANVAGAGELSDMLRDAADAIDDHLGRPRVHTDTANLPSIHPEEPKRPRFNPQPRGAK